MTPIRPLPLVMTSPTVSAADSSVAGFSLEALVDKVCKMVWTQGARAVFLTPAGVEFRFVAQTPPKEFAKPEFVGVFDAHATQSDVRDAIVETRKGIQ